MASSSGTVGNMDVNTISTVVAGVLSSLQSANSQSNTPARSTREASSSSGRSVITELIASYIIINHFGAWVLACYS